MKENQKLFGLEKLKRGAGGETRTLMSVTSPDFESGAYTNFATPAAMAFRLCQAILGEGH